MSNAVELTNAEQQMINLMRNDQHFTLTISCDGDEWHVRLEDHDSGMVSDGYAPTFDLGWDYVRDRRPA